MGVLSVVGVVDPTKTTIVGTHPGAGVIQSGVRHAVALGVYKHLWNNVSGVGFSNAPFGAIFSGDFITGGMDVVPGAVMEIGVAIRRVLTRAPPRVAGGVMVARVDIKGQPLRNAGAFIGATDDLSHNRSVVLRPMAPATLRPGPVRVMDTYLPRTLRFLGNLSEL